MNTLTSSGMLLLASINLQGSPKVEMVQKFVYNY